MKNLGFFGKRGFLVVFGILVVSFVSLFIETKSANAIETQTNISTRSTQAASGSSGDCYTTGYSDSSPCKKGSSTSVSAEVGSSYNMTFSHNFKTDNAGVSVDCTVTISKPSGSGTSYKLSDAGSSRYSYGLTSGSADCDATTSTGGAVSNSDRPYTDGDYKYIHRDFLEVKFLKAGTYKFCETIKASANGYSANTTGCITYKITDPNFTVTVKAYDRTSKKLLSGYSNSETASSGQLCAESVKDWGSISGYTFKGYTTSQTSTSYKSNPCSSSTITYYAIYEKEEQRTLTAMAINVADGNTNSSLAGSKPMDTDTVDKGSSATVTRVKYTGWTFLCWKTTKAAGTEGCMDTANSYKVNSLTVDTTVYAVYEKDPVNYTLTAKAVDKSGGFNTPAGNNPIATHTVREKYSATVSKVDYDNWVFSCWKTTQNGECVSNNASYTVESMTKDVTVYAMYEYGPKFEGKSDVTMSGNSYSTGWKDTSFGARRSEDCSPIEGCTISFKHHLRMTGTGSTSYKISRTSNYPAVVSNEDNLKTGTFSDTSGTVYTSETFTIKPGMVVCEIIWFNSTGGTGTDYDTYVRICAAATGNAQPEDPTSPDTPGTVDSNDPTVSNALLNIKVKNDTLNTGYQKEVYAKPGDSVTYRATYNPILQYIYHLIPERIQVDGGIITPSSGRNTELRMRDLFPEWNNGFAVAADFSEFKSNYTSTLGDTSLRKETNKGCEKTDCSIKAEYVGRTLTEKATFNTNDEIRTTPVQVSFSPDSNNYNVGNIITIDSNSDNAMRSASVKVPYNFNTDVEIPKKDNVVYAGETGNIIGYTISVNPRENKTLDGTYATVVRHGKLRVIVYKEKYKVTPEVGTSSWGNADSNICNYYVSDECKIVSNREDLTWNGSGLLTGEKESGEISVDVPDVKAGEKICMAIGIYPSSSGSDLNMEASGSNSWRISDPQCFSVAKKPSIQVWGGSMFSNGKIETPVSSKKQLAGYADGKYVFGSWTELGLVSNGSVTGFGSGAGLGYASIDNGAVSPYYYFESEPSNYVDGNKGVAKPGGADEFEKYCDITTLSFINSECSSSVGNLEGSASVDRESILEKLKESIPEDSTSIAESVGDGGEVTLGSRESRLIYSNSNMEIKNNIKYIGSYSSLDDVPKLFIYAASDINIDCNVERIDAVLIAEGAVNTCPTDFKNTEPNQGINSPGNSIQLRINGTIIANELIANRTYGAATGANSIIPAEIINYDSTLYLWGQNNTSALNAGKLDSNYQAELAPRY